MTRVNLVDPELLADQHLVAERVELRMLCSNLVRTLRSKSGFVESKLPPRFTLNRGHVYWFYNKGKYIHKRYERLEAELIKRGYKLDDNLTFPREVWPDKLYNDWEPTERDIGVIRERIRGKLLMKPDWYTLNKKPLTREFWNYWNG